VTRAALRIVLVGCLVGCSRTVEVERTLTPADASKSGKLAPVSIERNDETIAVPEGSVVEGDHIVVAGAANIMETDENGRVISVRNAAGEWSDPGQTIALRKRDRIVVRGTLSPGDDAPGGGKVVMKRQSGALAFGIISFGAAYLSAVIGGGISNDDRPLLAPIVGPWANLVMRPACVIDPVVGINCVPDTFARFGSVVSGLFQGLGVVFIIAGIPSRAAIEDAPEEKPKPEKAHIRIVPLFGGLRMIGTF
jgi:hypothetical protein